MSQELSGFQDANPERAYDWAELLASGSRMPSPQLRALENNPQVTLYSAAKKRLERLTKKYLGPGNGLGKEGDAEAKKLAETYQESSLGEIFSGLIQQVEKPGGH